MGRQKRAAAPLCLVARAAAAAAAAAGWGGRRGGGAVCWTSSSPPIHPRLVPLAPSPSPGRNGFLRPSGGRDSPRERIRPSGSSPDSDTRCGPPHCAFPSQCGGAQLSPAQWSAYPLRVHSGTSCTSRAQEGLGVHLSAAAAAAAIMSRHQCQLHHHEQQKQQQHWRQKQSAMAAHGLAGGQHEAVEEGSNRHHLHQEQKQEQKQQQQQHVLEQSDGTQEHEHEQGQVADAEHPSVLSLHGLTAHQLEFRSLAQEFAANELLPNAARWDEEKHFPVNVLRKAAQLGFAGLFCREDVGGTGLGRADGAVIFEALAYGDVSTTAYLTIHNMNVSILDRFGTEEQRQRWLPSLVSMDLLSSYCLTEPNSGSDAASLQTTARRAASSIDYILNGTKAFISGGGRSDVYLVMARTGAAGAGGISCFLVEKGTTGLSFGQQEKKLGWNSQPTCSVILEDVRVPCHNMVGGEGNGFRIAMAGLDGGRINIAACSVGGAQFCVEHALQYTTERKQFGRRIADFQNTQFALADAATAVESARLITRNAATALDARVPWATAAAAAAKRHATDVCYDVANRCLQMLGGYGYLRDYPVERYVRDLRVHTILEGTNEVMRLIIARRLLQRP